MLQCRCARWQLIQHSAKPFFLFYCCGPSCCCSSSSVAIWLRRTLPSPPPLLLLPPPLLHFPARLGRLNRLAHPLLPRKLKVSSDWIVHGSSSTTMVMIFSLVNLPVEHVWCWCRWCRCCSCVLIRTLLNASGPGRAASAGVEDSERRVLLVLLVVVLLALSNNKRSNTQAGSAQVRNQCMSLE